MSTLNLAIAIASEGHAGQVDKGGQSYILHPIRVMLGMRSDFGRIVGVLHDVVEDCPEWSPTRLHFLGFGADVTQALRHLNRPKDGLPYEEYIRHLCRSAPDVAVAVKVSDLTDNLRPDRLAVLPSAERDRLLKRYAPALELLTSSRDLREI